MKQKKHVFVCVQNRPAGHPRGACQTKGGPRVYQAFVDEFNRRGIWQDYRLTNTGCLGPCEHGASVVVYPDGVMYQEVTTRDVPTIIDEHLLLGAPVERLAMPSW